MNLQKLTLGQLYGSEQKANQRYSAINSHFQQIYQHKPDFFARAPGRVNLIGEHIDYQGYGVLPFAIEKDCVIAVRVISENQIILNHMDKSYPSCTITNDPFGEVEYIDSYVKYFVAGYRAATKEIALLPNLSEEILKKIQKKQFKGIQLLLQGNVPIAAGLSSSASFVICSALLTSYVNGFDTFVKKQYLIEQAIKYQKLVGMAGGGMDQSISMLGSRQSALYIQFNPIRAQKVNLPEGYKFVIMNSLVESKKLETIGTRYNKRVCECIAAVRLLGKNLGISKQVWGSWRILREAQEFLKIDLKNMGAIVDQFIQKKVYTREQIETLLEEPISQIFGSVINHEIVIAANLQYRLYQAAKHVYEQAERVLTFIEVCNSTLNNKSKAAVLGRLMNQSQSSCDTLYNCSSPEINEITNLALSLGALGSRLTGAGWGGCTVTLVEESRVQPFIESMKQKFYSKESLSKPIKEFGIENIVFETIPAQCASLVQY